MAEVTLFAKIGGADAGVALMNVLDRLRPALKLLRGNSILRISLAHCVYVIMVAAISCFWSSREEKKATCGLMAAAITVEYVLRR
jgi:hypothetical protein